MPALYRPPRIYSTPTYDSRRILAFTGPPPRVPTVAVDLDRKWTELWLVMPSGAVHRAPIQSTSPNLEDFEINSALGPAIGDHVWNPVYVERWAERHGYAVDPLSSQLLIGRWVMQVNASTAIDVAVEMNALHA